MAEATGARRWLGVQLDTDSCTSLWEQVYTTAAGIFIQRKGIQLARYLPQNDHGVTLILHALIICQDHCEVSTNVEKIKAAASAHQSRPQVSLGIVIVGDDTSRCVSFANSIMGPGPEGASPWIQSADYSSLGAIISEWLETAVAKYSQFTLGLDPAQQSEQLIEATLPTSTAETSGYQTFGDMW